MPTILPFGLSPLGLAVPQTVGPLQPAPVIAAEAFDPKTRDVATLLGSADVIDDQVAIALQVRRNSGAALGTTGQRYLDILKLGDSVQRLLENETRTALATLVSRGDIQIEAIAVDVFVPNQSAMVWVDYINRRTTGRRERRIPVPIEASTQ